MDYATQNEQLRQQLDTLIQAQLKAKAKVAVRFFFFLN